MFDLGIVLMAYAAIRLYENHQARREQKLITVEPNLEEQTVAEIAADDSEKQKDLHYIKVSAISVGLGALRTFYPPVALLSLGVFTYTAIPYLKRMEKSLIEEEKIDGYVLYGIADMMTLGLGRYATAAFGVGLVHTAHYVISNAQDKSKKMMIDVFAQQPQYVWILHDGVEIEIPLESLSENHIVVVTTGEVIPADGIVIQGIATVDQHALTGESQPAEKELGDRVFASTVLMAGRIHVKVDRSGQETTVAKIAQILNKSINYKTRTQLRGEQWADSWNVPVLGLAFLSMPILGAVGTVVILNGHIAQIIRVIAPLGTLNHLNVAAHKGILVKDGSALENLGKIDAILFDKTGTLTDEQPTVGQIIICDENYTEKQILAYAAAAECKLAHPIAKAIIQKAQDSNITLPNIADSKYQIGYGITVQIANDVVRVGSMRFMDSENIAISDAVKMQIQLAQQEGHSLVMVAIGNKICGILEMHASVRPEVKQLIQKLRKRGIKHLSIVSGDHQNPTQRLAAELGMDSYFHSVLPTNKAEIVEKLKRQGHSVCFIGDGINDTIAMKQANVSISLSGATSVATDTAQIVLMDGSLSHLSDLFEISDSLEKNLRNSLAINLSAGAITIGSAFLLRIDIITAMLITQAGLGVGLLNAMSPLKQLKQEELANTLNPNATGKRHEQILLLTAPLPPSDNTQNHS